MQVNYIDEASVKIMLLVQSRITMHDAIMEWYLFNSPVWIEDVAGGVERVVAAPQLLVSDRGQEHRAPGPRVRTPHRPPGPET